jgi:hypothetical protein
MKFTGVRTSTSPAASVFSLSIVAGAIGLTLAQVFGSRPIVGFLLGFITGFVFLTSALFIVVAFDKAKEPQNTYDEESCPLCSSSGGFGAFLVSMSKARKETPRWK